MAFSATARPSALAEMNVTPLVDVMLVLLIIFMVTAPLLSRPLDLSLPQGRDTPSPDKPSILSLDVAADGTLRLDDRPLSARDLRVRLDDALRSDPKTVLTLSASPDADYQQVVTALAEVRASGIEQVSWRGER
ncbi:MULTISPECIES: biopolymer transporter ExbD [Pseudoxanthomonas]|jgi:biopolymer transport protein ExbD|uniref:ExbD/TolR family protein n=1 Tax=Pseudoxanthomonas TaxID=83618 RepID=UPI0016083004|nr:MULTISPECIES: biopolymer transporter ExbD [Pseudoxanthomonas]MBB3276236.1 biopolymer transport protein ExbD [Pseudoxanthomonas sp. OG2]MBV7472686.1 biopolymer transporter ExbD [Pseudoxanthomonas sp. PXM05]